MMVVRRPEPIDPNFMLGLQARRSKDMIGWSSGIDRENFTIGGDSFGG